MGVVFKARQLALQRIVALKMLQNWAHAGEKELARFRAEADVIARLQHPNIVQIYDVGEVAGRPYFVLEYVAGGNLAQHLNGTPQSARLAAQFVEVLARAVQAAHANGVVHRDLKPANILLDSRRRKRGGSSRRSSRSEAPRCGWRPTEGSSQNCRLRRGENRVRRLGGSTPSQSHRHGRFTGHTQLHGA